MKFAVSTIILFLTIGPLTEAHNVRVGKKEERKHHDDHHSVREKRHAETVTLKTAKCIKPAVGVDPWLSDVVNTIVNAAICLGGAVACKASAGATCAGIAAASTYALQEASNAFAEAGITWLDEQFSGHDDLYITGPGGARWPEKGNVEVGSQALVNPNLSIAKGGDFCLWEDDWVSGDDNMGCVDTAQLPPGTSVLLIAHETEGSIYELEIYVPDGTPSY